MYIAIQSTNVVDFTLYKIKLLLFLNAFAENKFGALEQYIRSNCIIHNNHTCGQVIEIYYIHKCVIIQVV